MDAFIATHLLVLAEGNFHWISAIFCVFLGTIFVLTSCGRAERMPRNDPERQKRIREISTAGASKKETQREQQKSSSTCEKTKTEDKDVSKNVSLPGGGESDSAHPAQGKSNKRDKDGSSSRKRKDASKRKSREKIAASDGKAKSPAERQKPSKLEQELALDRTQSERETAPVKDESSRRSKRDKSPSKRERSLRTGTDGNYSSKSKRKQGNDENNNEVKSQRSAGRRRARDADVKPAVEVTAKEALDSKREKSQRSSKNKDFDLNNTQDLESRTQGSKRESGTSREKKKTKQQQYDELRKVRKEVNRKIKSRTETEKTADEGKSAESPYGTHRGKLTRKEIADKKGKKKHRSRSSSPGASDGTQQPTDTTQQQTLAVTQTQKTVTEVGEKSDKGLGRLPKTPKNTMENITTQVPTEQFSVTTQPTQSPGTPKKEKTKTKSFEVKATKDHSAADRSKSEEKKPTPEPGAANLDETQVDLPSPKSPSKKGALTSSVKTGAAARASTDDDTKVEIAPKPKTPSKKALKIKEPHVMRPDLDSDKVHKESDSTRGPGKKEQDPDKFSRHRSHHVVKSPEKKKHRKKKDSESSKEDPTSSKKDQSVVEVQALYPNTTTEHGATVTSKTQEYPKTSPTQEATATTGIEKFHRGALTKSTQNETQTTQYPSASTQLGTVTTQAAPTLLPQAHTDMTQRTGTSPTKSPYPPISELPSGKSSHGSGASHGSNKIKKRKKISRKTASPTKLAAMDSIDARLKSLSAMKSIENPGKEAPKTPIDPATAALLPSEPESFRKKKKRTGEKSKNKTADGSESSGKSSKSSKSSKIKSKFTGLLKTSAEKAKDKEGDSSSKRK